MGSEMCIRDRAIAALVSWGELDESLVDQPICDDCYEELREALIDGESEVAASHSKAS